MQEWLGDLVGESLAPIATWALAAAIVIVLVFVVVWIARKALGGSAGPRAKGRGPRLAVMDVAAIDPKRKLVLVRRDEVEHLLLIGGQNDVVVEAGILRVAAGTRRVDPARRLEPELAAAERLQAAPARLTPAGRAVEAPAAARADAASPLTRAVPRPPEAASALEAAPTVQPPREAARAPAADPEPAPSPVAPTPSVASPIAEPPAARPVPTPAVESEAPRPASAPTHAAPAVPSPVTEPIVPPQRGENRTGDATLPPPRREPSFSPAPATEARPAQATPGEPMRAPRPAASVTRPAAPEQRLPDTGEGEAPRVEPVRRTTIPAPGGDASARPAIPARNPIATAAPTRDAAGQGAAPRVSITGTEPFRRVPTPPAQPSPQRSMATPTYPQRAPADTDPLPQGQPSEPGNAASREAPHDAASGDPVAASAASEILAGRPAGPTSPIIAAAERQREMLRNRPAASAPPVRAPIAAPVPPAVEPDEKRPLSVRSFATAIQSGRSPEPAASVLPPVPPTGPVPSPAAPPVNPAPPISVAPPIPAPPPTPAAPPIPVQPPVSVAPPVSLAVPAATVAPSVIPTASPIVPPVEAVSAPATAQAAAPPVELDAPAPDRDDSGLEDFLSAELDSDFGNVSWSGEAAAPERAAAAPTPAVEPDGPRIMTLEEEMERLLGDFDFDTSDRRSR